MRTKTVLVVAVLVLGGLQVAEAGFELNRKVVMHIWGEPGKGTASDGKVEQPQEMLVASQDYAGWGGHEMKSTELVVMTADGRNLVPWLTQSGCNLINPFFEKRAPAFRFWSQERDENGKDTFEEIPTDAQVPPGQVYSELYTLQSPNGKPNPNCPAILITNKRYIGPSNDGPGHLSWMKGGLNPGNHKWIRTKLDWEAEEIEFVYPDGLRATFIKIPRGTDYECDRDVLRQEGCSWFTPWNCKKHDPIEPLCTPP